MIEFVRGILFQFGINASAIPDIVLVIGACIVIIVVLRIVLEILEQFLSIGCTIISIIVIILLLFDYFGTG